MKNLKRKRAEDDYNFKYSEIECPICMDEMKIESRSVTAPCMHEFCLQCIGKWLMESSSRLCPLCKQLVKKIMYSIENKQKYSIIGFPTDFCAGWTVRNKMKAVFDDFDSVLRKIYCHIKYLFERDRSCADTQILSYLVWFANVKVRLMSRETADEVPIPPSLIIGETNFTNIKVFLTDRLNMIFKPTTANRIINEIYIKNDNKIQSLPTIISILEEYIDPEKLDMLKVELECCILQPSPLYLEYYIPLRHNGNEAILFTDGRLVDDKVVAALVTKMLCSFNFEFEATDDRLLVAHVNIVHELLSTVDQAPSSSSSATNEKLLIYLSEVCYFLLHSNRFYRQSCKLKNQKKIEASLISNKAYSLVKHCLQEELQEQHSLLGHATEALADFERQNIYTEPLLVNDDSSSSDSDDVISSKQQQQDDGGEDAVEITDIYVEISDSDEDALQVLSVHPPPFNLVEDFTEDGMEFIPFRKRLHNDRSINDKPSTSAKREIVLNKEEAEVEDTDDDVCVIGEQISDSNRLNIDFIYQPRSAEDFYQFLLAENNVDD